MIVFWKVRISIETFFAWTELFIILWRTHMDVRVIIEVVRWLVFLSPRRLGIEFRNIEVRSVDHWNFNNFRPLGLSFLTEDFDVYIWVKLKSWRHIASAHTAVVGHWGVNCVGCLNWIGRQKSRFIRFERATGLAILILQIIDGITIMLITRGLEFVLNHPYII